MLYTHMHMHILYVHAYPAQVTANDEIDYL